jgi:thiol-disulfide isomerase/thioredoxin
MLRCFMRNSSGKLGLASTARRSISSLLTKSQQTLPRISKLKPLSLTATLSTNAAASTTTPSSDVSKIVLGSVVEASEDVAETVISKMRNTTVFVGMCTYSNCFLIMCPDFHADWCGPCKVLGPILINAVKEDGRAILLKVDVDSSAKISAGLHAITI